MVTEPRGRGAQSMVSLVCLLALALGSGPARGQEVAGRFYLPSGHTLAAEFVGYYDAHGGLDLFGYPLTEGRMEGGYRTQYFERQRLELHPNLPPEYRVSLGLLGREQTAFRSAEASFRATTAQVDSDYFAEVGHNLGGDFRDYWRQHGGLAIFGYPLSETYLEGGFTVQWFERARFELHPELPTAYRVTLGQLGRAALPYAGGPQATVRISSQLAPSRSLKFGFSEGGESYDPRFFNNVIERSSDLHPRLIRLDNIFNYYNVVNFDKQGNIYYNWTGLDALVDAIYKMGAEPMFALSYMPPSFAPKTGGSNQHISPPADYARWQQLIYDTVHHFNVERLTPVHYLAVWNEPDSPGFWRGTYADYFLLYDASYRGATAADPTIKLGGPGLTSFIPNLLDDFLQHCTATGARLDFLDWHAYGRSGEQVRREVEAARKLLARHPSLHPELMISEWNVATGGADDTSLNNLSDTAAAAVHALSVLNGMERGGLDWGLLFELKDGYREGKPYWGRWGVMSEGGGRKPIYHALQAYQALGNERLVVQTSSDRAGAIAGLGGQTIVAWFDSDAAGRLSLALATGLPRSYDLYLLDPDHSNPAAGGSDELQYATSITADSNGLLTFNLKPQSVLILKAR